MYTDLCTRLWCIKSSELCSGQLRMAQGSTCMECVHRRFKLITACVCVNQLYIKGGCINCDYITLVLDLNRKRADWMHSKFMLFVDF